MRRDGGRADRISVRLLLIGRDRNAGSYAEALGYLVSSFGGRDIFRQALFGTLWVEGSRTAYYETATVLRQPPLAFQLLFKN